MGMTGFDSKGVLTVSMSGNEHAARNNFAQAITGNDYNYALAA